MQESQPVRNVSHDDCYKPCFRQNKKEILFYDEKKLSKNKLIGIFTIESQPFPRDHVSGDDNDHNKVERIRVNSRDEFVQQKNGEKSKLYRDVYGGRIEKPAEAAK